MPDRGLRLSLIRLKYILKELKQEGAKEFAGNAESAKLLQGEKTGQFVISQ